MCILIFKLSESLFAEINADTEIKPGLQQITKVVELVGSTTGDNKMSSDNKQDKEAFIEFDSKTSGDSTTNYSSILSDEPIISTTKKDANEKKENEPTGIDLDNNIYLQVNYN